MEKNPDTLSKGTTYFQMNILVTGAAGFIGFHLSKRLLDENYHVIGVDSLNEYYDAHLKKDRLNILKKNANFEFYKIDLADQESLIPIFENRSINFVINLAAQAGVRYSLHNPHSYVHSNLFGFINILEACRHYQV
jgi:UDP-glucuronate 4-epimerase